jgi:hypothetical protein
VKCGNDISNYKEFLKHVKEDVTGVKIVEMQPINPELEEEINKAGQIRGMS